MIPGDGIFKPYQRDPASHRPKLQGRIFVLRFQSSTQRHFFWLQSGSQHEQGDKSWFSPRDLKLGEIVNRLLQGDEVNVTEEMASVPAPQGGDDDDDSGSRMEDVRQETPSGAAENHSAQDPFLGNPEDEGHESREGGADGGRA